jgi:hypothetical protein
MACEVDAGPVNNIVGFRQSAVHRGSTIRRCAGVVVDRLYEPASSDLGVCLFLSVRPGRGAGYYRITYILSRTKSGARDTDNRGACVVVYSLYSPEATTAYGVLPVALSKVTMK